MYWLVRQKDRDGKDVQQVRGIEDRDRNVLTGEKSIRGDYCGSAKISKGDVRQALGEDGDGKGRWS